MPIDTHVDADPSSCRTTAQWLDGIVRAGEAATSQATTTAVTAGAVALGATASAVACPRC